MRVHFIRKEKTMICDRFKEVTLLCARYKIPANIPYLKLVPYAEEIRREC